MCLNTGQQNILTKIINGLGAQLVSIVGQLANRNLQILETCFGLMSFPVKKDSTPGFYPMVVEFTRQFQQMPGVH